MGRYGQRAVGLVLLSALSLAVPLLAQDAAVKAALEEAAVLYQAQDWAKAAAAYAAIVEQAPTNGQAWFRLGLSRHNLKQYEQAVASFQRAEETGFVPQFTRYNLAGSYARLNQKEEALEWLRKAVAAGFANPQQLETDEDLRGLHDAPRFEKIVQEVKVNALPCEHLPVYRQFDFWVGDWEVFTPQGVQAGTNSIQRVAGGCILLENWISTNGPYTGKSINYYDPSRGKWVQVWVDSSGTVIPIEGELKDGAMHLQGEFIYKEGNKDLFRGAWMPLADGRVRQFIEQSKDGGKTWAVWFDGFYVRKTD